MSERLKQIQAAIGKLIDAKTAGSAAEIAAAQTLLNSPLSPDLTPQQALDAANARVAQFSQVIKRLEDIPLWAKAATDGLDIATANLEAPDRLAIPPEKIDAGIDAALGITAQAASKVFVVTEPGVVIEGGKPIGRVTPAMINVLDVLRNTEETITPSDIADQIGTSRGSAVEVLGRLFGNEVGGRLVAHKERGKYQLQPGVELLGREIGAGETIFIPAPHPVEEPASYRISQVLADPAIGGNLSETQLRRLNQDLLDRKMLKPEVHIVKGKIQRRGASQEEVPDLKLTEPGKKIIAAIAAQFAGEKRVPTNEVVSWLSQPEVAAKLGLEVKVETIDRVKPKPAGVAPDPKKLFWGISVTEKTGVSQGVLDALQRHGDLQDNNDIIYTRGGKRVYRGTTLGVVEDWRQIAAKAGAELTPEFILSAPKHVDVSAIEKTIDKYPESITPYGKNGADTYRPEIGLLLLNTIVHCLPAARRKVGPDILAGADAELKVAQKQLAEQIGEIIPADRGGLVLLAAATAYDLIVNGQFFVPLAETTPALRLAMDFTQQILDKKPEYVAEFPEAVMKLPVSRPDLTTLGPDNLVGNTILVGAMGDKK